MPSGLGCVYQGKVRVEEHREALREKGLGESDGGGHAVEVDGKLGKQAEKHGLESATVSQTEWRRIDGRVNWRRE